MINDSVFNCDAASASSNSGFDKNEYYVENGLAKRQKKDNKSRSYIAAVQTEAREKLLAEKISLLPKKMQAKLAETATAVKPGKTKTKHVTKAFHNRQKITQDLLLEAYDEEILAEDDTHNEHIVEVRDEAYEKHWAQYIEAMKEESLQAEEEARYQTYLGNKNLWDFPEDGMSQWDMMLLKDEIEEYEKEFAAKREESEQTWKVIYEDHKYELDYCRSDWTAKELQFFQKKVDEYEAAHGINQKCEPEEIWLEYGLTKEQYEANQEYETNCGDLAAFYLEPDYANYPDYEIRLKAAIKKYEDDWNTQRAAELVAEDNNDWWIDEKYAKEALEDDELCVAQEKDETVYSEPDPDDMFEDWLERKKDEDMDDCRQEMREFLNDDY